MQNNYSHTNSSPMLEITVISAQGLKTASFPFSKRIRPFITLSTTSTSANMKMYTTRVDDEGGVNPTWGDKFHICLDETFFNHVYPGIHLQLYTKHLLLGKGQLGWCRIPAADIANQITPVGTTQFLSYRLRDMHGERGQGVVNVAVRLNSSFPIVHSSGTSLTSNTQQLTETNESDQTVIGIPVFQQKF